MVPVTHKLNFWSRRLRDWRRIEEIQYPTAAHLAEAADEYFNELTDNPLEQDQLFAYKGDVTRDVVYKMRAFTISGLCVHLGLSPTKWADLRQREGYEEVVAFIELVIATQKYEGAAAGLLNANLVARDLGLAERKELTGPNGAPLTFKDETPLSEAQLEEELRKRGLSEDLLKDLETAVLDEEDE